MLPNGLSAFPITPSDPDGRVDTDALQMLVERLCGTDVDSIGLLGSTGIYAYLSRAERRKAIEVAVEKAGGRKAILAGVGALRIDATVLLAKDAKAAGATAGLLAAVSYTPLTQDEVFEHFRIVAEESGLPLCIYDNPGTTHFAFTPGLVGRLARLDGIVAVKSPTSTAPETAAHLARLRTLVPAEFSLGYSGDWNATEALIAGADTWYGVLAGLFPQNCGEIVRAVRRGDADEARRLDARLAPIWDLFRAHSSLRVMYACANALGITQAVPPRPILPLGPVGQEHVADVLVQLELR